MKILKTDNIERIGNNIKRIRKRKGLTIAELGRYTGLSVGYLSNVERNKTSPTLRNLGIISNSLGISIMDLIETKMKSKVVIPRKDAIKLNYEEYNMNLEIIEFDIDMGVYTYITIEPGKTDSVADFVHPYAEVCTVIEGQLTIIMEGENYILDKGDSIYIKEHVRHIMRNDSNIKCVSFWHRKRTTIL